MSQQPTIFFIHGFPFNRSMWDDQVAYFRKDFQIITYDIRGHGKAPISEQPFFLEHLVEDLNELVDRVAVPVILCGLSMGGYIALRFIERFPAKCKALILCDTKSEADPDAAKLKRASQITQIAQQGVDDFAEGFLKAVLAPETLSQKPDVVGRIRSMIVQMKPAAVQAALLALATRTDTTASLNQINVPTLVLTGAFDGVTPPAAGQALARAIPGAEFVLVPNAGHVSNMENPDFFHSALRAFLTRYIH